MKLHTSLTSPYARKVHIIAALKNIPLDEVPAIANGIQGYTGGVNPLGKIPTLEIIDDIVLYDSPVICEYLDSFDTPLLPSSGNGRWHQKHLHALGDGLSDAVYNYRYEVVRPEALHWPQQIQRHETAILSAVMQLEADHDDLGAPWAFGNIAIICALDYADFRAGHLDWRRKAPKLAAWHKTFTRESIWIKTYGYT